MLLGEPTDRRWQSRCSAPTARPTQMGQRTTAPKPRRQPRKVPARVFFVSFDPNANFAKLVGATGPLHQPAQHRDG
ncbi:MAG: hypothetical protein WKG07_19225 [Hymenobacter sp.]